MAQLNFSSAKKVPKKNIFGRKYLQKNPQKIQ